MKPILPASPKKPLYIQPAFYLITLIGLLSFFFSLKYAGEQKKVYPALVPDKSLPVPQCSINGGFFAGAKELTLTAASAGKIYYTLDGSAPTLASAVYTGPITITPTDGDCHLCRMPTSPRWQPPLGDVFTGITLRAICVSENEHKSRELVKTFFIDKKAERRYSVPVIAITADEEDLFGYKNGIYVLGKDYADKQLYAKKNITLNLPWWSYPSNYLEKGKDAERPVHIEFFEHEGKGFEANAGVRISGNATRGFSQKSLRVVFGSKYGTNTLRYRLFPDISTTEFNSFILRNSGNDWDKTMFRDAFMQSLMKGSAVETQAYRPCVVFINGEYWGLHNLRERFDENYLANKYGIPTDSITILELGGNLFFGKRHDPEGFRALLDYVNSHNLADPLYYQELERKMDVQSFMDFIIANVYFCNSDWPNNNIRFWRYKREEDSLTENAPRDGRWRWMLYDTDWGFGLTGAGAVEMNLLEKARTTGSTGLLFDALLKNRTFIEKFEKRFNYHLENTFSPDKVIVSINRFEQELAPEMEEHIRRWRVIGNYEKWKGNVEELRNFAKQRPAIQRRQLDKFLQEQKGSMKP